MPTATPFTEIEFDAPPPEECQWFALCAEPATHMVEHPVLEWVATCTKHVKWLAEMENSTR